MVRLLILGTGFMAGNHAMAFSAHPDCTVVGAADIDPQALAAFLSKHDVPQGFHDIEEALDWGGFDAVANVTPDAVHHPTTMQLIEAEKHVFCEKPLAVNAADAGAMADAIESAGLVGMVNLIYRNASAIQKAREFVAAGRIGEVRHVEASYLQSWLTANYWGDWRTTPTFLWRLSEAHGSKGVLGDVGIHIADFASYGADSEIADVSCSLKTFDKAEGNRIGEYLLDANDSATMTVGFRNGAIGVIHATRFATGYQNRLALQVFGTRGAIRLDLDKSWSELEICEGADVHHQRWTKINCGEVATNYSRFVEAVMRGATLEPSFRRAANLQAVLDSCFESNRTGRRITL